MSNFVDPGKNRGKIFKKKKTRKNMNLVVQ